MRILRLPGGLAVAVVAMLTAACSGATGAGNNTVDTASAACQSSMGVTANTIKLGVLTALSGPYASSGVNISQVNQAFWAYVNDHGGIDGRKVELEIRDNQFNAQQAIQQYKNIAGNVFAVASSLGSPANNALGPQAAKDCMVVMSPGGGTSATTPTVFATYTPYEYEAINMLDWYRKQPGKEKARVAVVYQDDALGKPALAAIQYATPKLGLELVATVPITGTEQNFSGQVAKLQAARPDVIYVAGTYIAANGIVGQADSTGNTDWEYLVHGSAVSNDYLKLPTAKTFETRVFAVDCVPVYASGLPEAKTAGDIIHAAFPTLALGDIAGLTAWVGLDELYQALQAASKANKLTREGLLETVRTLRVRSKVVPTDYAFGSIPGIPNAPYGASGVMQLSSSTPGGWRIVAPFEQSPVAAGFKP
ncbi:ABC transporter substrate-binding protein [Dactylosporangium sp. NPDC000555]|uniref:ABC transporter substrate-binding protein n=1 Tax=Dactylosporangium sp. NPDC000555 TaxID=3154260 RepID=UPI00332E03E3